MLDPYSFHPKLRAKQRRMLKDYNNLTVALAGLKVDCEDVQRILSIVRAYVEPIQHFLNLPAGDSEHEIENVFTGADGQG